MKNTKGLITQAFVMMDSHAYTDGDIFGLFWKYDNIHDNQVEWYKSEIQRMNKENEKINKKNEPVIMVENLQKTVFQRNFTV